MNYLTPLRLNNCIVEDVLDNLVKFLWNKRTSYPAIDMINSSPIVDRFSACF
jgi:hypothetical protein